MCTIEVDLRTLISFSSFRIRHQLQIRVHSPCYRNFKFAHQPVQAIPLLIPNGFILAQVLNQQQCGKNYFDFRSSFHLRIAPNDWSNSTPFEVHQNLDTDRFCLIFYSPDSPEFHSQFKSLMSETLSGKQIIRGITSNSLHCVTNLSTEVGNVQEVSMRSLIR